MDTFGFGDDANGFFLSVDNVDVEEVFWVRRVGGVVAVDVLLILDHMHAAPAFGVGGGRRRGAGRGGVGRGLACIVTVGEGGRGGADGWGVLFELGVFVADLGKGVSGGP